MMAHPYFHAVSSAKRFGGAPCDYQVIHDWFDQSKSVWAAPQHRALRHHQEAVERYRIHFIDTVRNSDGEDTPSEIVGLQHIEEDHGFQPTMRQWTEAMTPEAWMMKPMWTPSAHADHDVTKWGGVVSDYLPVHLYLDSHASDSISRYSTHHSFGIFEVEQAIGKILTNKSGRQVPIRVIAEAHVAREFGFIPTPSRWLSNMHLQRWMITPSSSPDN